MEDKSVNFNSNPWKTEVEDPGIYLMEASERKYKKEEMKNMTKMQDFTLLGKNLT